MTYAAAADLANLLGRDIVTAEEVAKAHTVLAIVDTLIDAHLDGRAAAAEVTKTVATLAGRRLFTLPDGVSQEMLGDWQSSYTSTQLLSDDERALLDYAGTGGVRRRRTASPKLSADIWAAGT